MKFDPDPVSPTPFLTFSQSIMDKNEYGLPEDFKEHKVRELRRKLEAATPGTIKAKPKTFPIWLLLIVIVVTAAIIKMTLTG